MSNIQTVVDIYFEAFTKKDIAALSDMYAENIRLNEWNENIFVGKEEVLNANKKLFDQFQNISIKTVSYAIDTINGIIFNEIIVNLDGQEVKVIDIIGVQNNKITYIRAYKGF